MVDHLTSEELDRLVVPNPDPSDRTELRSHLSRCALCRSEFLRRSAASGRDFSALIREPDEDNHLSYAQIEAIVNSQVTEIDREIIESHVDLCSSCRDRIRSLQAFATELARPVSVRSATPEAPQSLWQRVQSFISMKPAWAVASAAAAIVVFTVLVQQPVYELAERSLPGGIQSSALRSVPTEYRERFASLLSPQDARIPALLESLRTSAPTRDAALFPADRVIRERNPILRWPGTPGRTYFVEVTRGAEVVASADVNGTEWRVSVDLPRGEVYSWTVAARSAGDPLGTAQARFAVLSEPAESELARIVLDHGDSHPLLAVAYLDAGLLHEAENQLDLWQAADGRQARETLRARIEAIRREVFGSAASK